MTNFRSISVALVLIFFNLSCNNHSSGKVSEVGKSGGLSLIEKGKALIAAKGCVACHSVDGSRMVGPSYKGIYGTSVKLMDGSTVKVDDQYIRESIENPMTKIVEGYPPSMPVYKGMVSDEEIAAITEYIKSLK